MSKKVTKYSLYIPYNLIRDETINNRPGIIMVYCLFKRYGSVDGKITTNLAFIFKKLNLQYQGTKKKEYPLQLKNIIEGIDFLCENNYCTLKSGDYRDYNNNFDIQINLDIFQTTNFITLDFADFDYVINYKDKRNKSYMFFVLCWVCSNFINYKDDKHCIVCSYPLRVMEKYMGMKAESIRRYLNYLSCKEGYDGEQPLYKSKKYSFSTQNGRPLNFTNIYVENSGEPLKVIEFKKAEIREKLKLHNARKNTDYVFEEVQVDDETYQLFGYL